MRLLLAALLMILQAQAPALAGTLALDGSGNVSSPCHAMPAQDGQHEHKAGHNAPAAVHACPGCALPALAAPAPGEAGLVTSLPEPAPLASLVSLTVRPGLPPPRHT